MKTPLSGSVPPLTDIGSLSSMPLLLSFVRARRTYTGGKLLEQLHGLPDPKDSDYPEEWIASVVEARGDNPQECLSRVMLNGRQVLLRSLIRRDPAGMLGEAHAARYGESPGMLVKLIDAAERLTVQVHPDREFARQYFQSPFGKTEAWYILGTRCIAGEKPCLYMGF